MNRKIGIAIIILSLLLLIGIIYIVFFHKFEQPAVEQEVKSEQVQPKEQALPKLNTAPAATITETQKPVEIKKDDLKRIAASFAERFGSFSNQSNFSNIEDLKIFMASTMKNWAESYMAELRAKRSDPAMYYGVTTKAVSTTVKDYDDDLGKAEILVRTKRREATGTTANASSFYQDITIDFIKEDGVWKVSGAYWQGK